MHPTIGRIVLYNTTDSQRIKMKNSQNCNVSEVLPATVVAVWSPIMVNLKVHLDGEGDLWVTSVHMGTGEGEWEWPKIETDMPHSDAKV